MINLWTMSADIVLTANSVIDDMTKTVDDAKAIADEIDELSKPPETTGSTKLANVLTDAQTVSNSISEAKASANDVDVSIQKISNEGSSVLSGLMDTFAGVAGMLVESVVAGIFEVGAESIEMAAAEDSALAQAYNATTERLTITQDLAKMQIGNALLPVATAIKELTDNVLSFVFNIDDADKLTAYLDQLETYEADNLKEVSANLKGVFGAFEQVDKIRPDDFSALSAGVVSQTRFWTDYDSTLNSLLDRGISADFLSEIADGSKESLAQMMSLANLDDADLQTFLASYEQLTAARAAAAETINSAQVEVDLAADNVETTVAEMVMRLDQAELAKLSMGATTDSIVSVLSEAYPIISAQVDNINDKISQLGSTQMAYTSESLEQLYMQGVSPYAFLPPEHAGALGVSESKAQPSVATSVGIDAATLKQAFFEALMQWGQPVGASAFGAIIAPQINADIARGTRGVR